MSKTPSHDERSVCAVFVTYRPDSSFRENVARVAAQVRSIVVVDNQSSDSSLAVLGNLTSEFGVHLICNAENRGVATALNQGTQWAMANGFSWALLLDQDTIPSPDMVEGLWKVYEAVPLKEGVAVVGCSYASRPDPVDTRAQTRADVQLWREVRTTITSGSLLNLQVFRQVGPFRDEFFIDSVDLEYCLRARSLGYKVAVASANLMQHDIGHTSWHRLPWKTTGTSNHSPLRRYYMMRNHVVLIREYLFKDPLWAIVSTLNRLKAMVLVLLFERSKWQKLKYTWLGLVDGLVGRFGRPSKELSTPGIT